MRAHTELALTPPSAPLRSRVRALPNRARVRDAPPAATARSSMRWGSCCPRRAACSRALPAASLPNRFDGGGGGAALDALIAELQPQAIGIASDLGPNWARLIGDESGFSPYPVWVTPGGTESGQPDSAAFQPPEADTPIGEAPPACPSTTHAQEL